MHEQGGRSVPVWDIRHWDRPAGFASWLPNGWAARVKREGGGGGRGARVLKVGVPLLSRAAAGFAGWLATRLVPLGDPEQAEQGFHWMFDAPGMSRLLRSYVDTGGWLEC